MLKYIVKSHYRFRSCDSLKYLLKCIFPDSAVTEKISMGKDKARYLIIYVIYVIIYMEFKQKMKSMTNNFLCVSTSFDESQ